MKLVIFLFVFFLTSSAWAQNIEVLDDLNYTVYYRIKAVLDTSRPDKKYEELMVLQVGNEISKFFAHNSYLSDSTVMTQKNVWAAQQSAGTKFQYSIFNNYPKGYRTHKEGFLSAATLLYEEELKPLQWQILQDTMRIHGYLCQKAKTNFSGRDFVAWFTMDIPYRHAPYKFDGLPGFIMTINDTQNHYKFDFVRLEKNKNPDIKIYQKQGKYYKMKREQFLKKQAEIHNRSIDAIMADYGRTISIEPPEAAHRYKQLLRKQSNRIEIK